MTYVFLIKATISQCWERLRTEYDRWHRQQGHPPFEFESPKHSLINEYAPGRGDEIVFVFWDSEHKERLLVVEIEPIPAHEARCNVFVHEQGNIFEEPVRSSIRIWKEFEKALLRKKSGKSAKRRRKPQGQTLTALNALRELRAESLKNQSPILPRTAAAREVGISKNTWRIHDRKLWDQWDTPNTRGQKEQ